MDSVWLSEMVFKEKSITIPTLEFFELMGFSSSPCPITNRYYTVNIVHVHSKGSSLQGWAIKIIVDPREFEFFTFDFPAPWLKFTGKVTYKPPSLKNRSPELKRGEEGGWLVSLQMNSDHPKSGLWKPINLEITWRTWVGNRESERKRRCCWMNWEPMEEQFDTLNNGSGPQIHSSLTCIKTRCLWKEEAFEG